MLRQESLRLRCGLARLRLGLARLAEDERGQFPLAARRLFALKFRYSIQRILQRLFVEDDALAPRDAKCAAAVALDAPSFGQRVVEVEGSVLERRLVVGALALSEIVEGVFVFVVGCGSHRVAPFMRRIITG